MTRQGHSKLSLEGRETGILVPGVYDVGQPNAGSPNTTVVTVAGGGLQSYWTDYRNYQIGDPFTLSLISSSLEVFPCHIILQRF
jgi:hypothetical protein